MDHENITGSSIPNEDTVAPSDETSGQNSEPSIPECVETPASSEEMQNVESQEDAEDTGNDNTAEAGVQAKIALVNRMVKTIHRMRAENAILEMRVSDSDQQNRLLQLQIDILMKKMELLEGFVAQVSEMENDNKDHGSLCRKCKQRVESGGKSSGKDRGDDDDDDDDDDKEFKEFMAMYGCGSQESRDCNQNPLMIDVIVANVLKYMPMATLVKCREVNHLWCGEASYILKQRQLLTINHDTIDKLSSLMTLASSDTPSGSNFLFRRIKFDIGFLVKTYRDVLEGFFSKYGPQIHHFNLHCEQENSAILYTEEVRNLFLPFLQNVEGLELSLPTKITERQTLYEDIRPKKFLFPKLTTLRLHQMDATLDVGGYTVPVVKELLKACPSLRSFYVETHTKEVVTRILLAMSDKECRSITNQLEHLYLDGFVTEEHLRYLLPLDFRLKTVQLSYFTLEVTSSMVEAFLSKQRTTLETLIFGDYQKRATPNSLPLIVKLPVLRELTHLKFVDPLFPDHRQVMFNPLNYSDQLPRLAELTFEHEMGKPAGAHYFQDLFICSPTQCKTLKILRISHGLGDPQLVASGAKMFPNLTRLELAHAPDPVLQAVWKEFTGIKILYLYLNPTNLNIDSLLTGIPDQVCRRIQEKNLFSQVDIMNAIDIIRTESSISNLTELETLRIDGFTSSLLTAVTGYLGLCQMKNLSNISIKGDIITLSRECRRVLGEKLHLSLLEFF